MSKGSINMAKKGVIVKRLSAIPDLAVWIFYAQIKPEPLRKTGYFSKIYRYYGQRNTEVLRLAYINGFFETGIKSILDKAI